MILSGSINLESGKFKINNSILIQKILRLVGQQDKFMSQYNILIDDSLKNQYF